jgi:hypothetical protein
MKAKDAKKTEYLAFCEECGVPKVIPINVIRSYWLLKGVNKIYCESCHHANVIPEYLRKMHNEL